MRKIILGWIVLAAAMLVPSTVLGLILTAAIGPEPTQNYGWNVGGRAGGAPVVVANQIGPRTATQFNPFVKPTAQEAEDLARPVRAVSQADEQQPVGDFLATFDTQRMAEEETPLGFYRLRNISPTDVAIGVAAGEIGSELESLYKFRPELLPTGAVQVVRVGWSPDRQEALVIARHTATTGQRKTVRYVRWWLSQTLAGWLIYDFDSPATHLRFLATRNYFFNRSAKEAAAAEGVPPGLEAVPQPRPVDRIDVAIFNRYRQGAYWLSLAGTGNDPALMRAREAENDSSDLNQIDAVIAARKALQHRLAALTGRAGAAQTYSRLAAEKWSDTPGNLLATATARNAQKKYAEALVALNQYRAAVGDHPEAYREEAKARAGLKDDPKAAIAVIQMGLLEFPGEPSLLIELARRVPANERPAVGEEIAKAGTSQVLQVAATLFEDPALLDALCAGFLRTAPDDALAQVQAIHAKVGLQQFQAAGELLKKLRAANAPIWGYQKGELLRDPRALQRPLDYYELFALIGEAEDIYRTLARRHSSLEWAALNAPVPAAELKDLDALNAAHAAKFPNDPELGYWKALALFDNDEWAKADAELVTAMAKLKKPTSPDRYVYDGDVGREEEHEWGWEAYRRLRTRCLVKLGKWKQAYDDLSPAMDTFDQLAEHFESKEDSFALGELVELHAKQHPNDAELAFWRGEVQFLKKNYEAALKQFTEIYNKKAIAQAPIDSRVRERLIRCYLRLKRPAEAKAVVDHAQGQRDILGSEVFFRALIAVAANEPDDLLEIFDQNAVTVAALYADPDAAAVLTKPAFARVRQKYPPPVR